MSIQSKNSGFTLIELLVVVAIIAIIGAGVGVLYNRLDERAKTAMEMNDIGVLTKTLSHWSFLHDGKLPNRLDSLVTTDGEFYSAMANAMSTGDVGNGVGMQAGFTFESKPAPAAVISALASAGIDTIYQHLPNVTPANESTYVSTTNSAGAKVMDTSTTVKVLESDATNAKLKAQAIVDYNSTATAALADGTAPAMFLIDWTDADGNAQVARVPSAMWAMIYANMQETANADSTDMLTFVWPEGGTQMAMNLANEIIVNAGLKPDLVASPDMEKEDAIAAGKMYWLVVFGIGRFAEIYEGNGARVDQPVSGKRYTDENYYNRYLMVVKVPVTGYDSMTGQNAQKSSVAAILSPIGLSRTRLESSYQEAVEATRN